MSENDSVTVPAAERTLNILELLAANPEGLTAGELLARLDLSRTSLFALLQTLKNREYLVQPAARGPYQLGPALWALVPGRAQGVQALLDGFYAAAVLEKFTETVALLRLDGADCLLLGQRQPRTAVRVVHEPGARTPAWGSAAGRVLLAGVPAPQRPAPPAGCVVDLRLIQKSGVARSEEADMVQLAAPVCADGVQPTAALQVSIPAFRHRTALEEQLRQQLRQAAARLSYRLGAALYQPYGWVMGDAVGPTRSLSAAELRQFLEGPWGGRMACVRGDGTPHVVPLWYEWDGTAVWVTASPGAQWKSYVIESKRVSLTIDEPWPPLRRAFIVGEAVPVVDGDIPGGLAGLRQRLAVRYLGQGAESRSELTNTAGWSAFRIDPVKINGRQGL